jgi:ATP-dependent Clp protease ATP-binding subunit ClpC
MLDEAKRVFKPELFNRMDDVIVFRPLSRDDVGLILELELHQVRARMAAKHIEIQLSPEAKTFLIEKGFDENYGARPLRRAIEKFVQDPLAEDILAGRLGAAQSVEVRRAGDKLVFVPVEKTEISDTKAEVSDQETEVRGQRSEVSKQ